MSVLTPRERAQGVHAHLRALGPQTIAEIQSDLRLTKREVEHALWLLGSQGKVEDVWPRTSPATYRAVAT